MPAEILRIGQLIEGVDSPPPPGRTWDVRLTSVTTEPCSHGGESTRRTWDDGVTVVECDCGYYHRQECTIDHVDPWEHNLRRHVVNGGSLAAASHVEAALAEIDRLRARVAALETVDEAADG